VADTREMRRQLLVMIGVIVVVDAIAIGAWFLAGIRGRGAVVQLLFAIVWTAATLAAVVVSMRKIREAGKGRRGEGRMGA
jgi:hypothetical protein